MNATERFIEDAVKSGWIYRQGLSFYRWEICSMGHPWVRVWFDPDQGDQWQDITIEEILLDLDAWRAVGKTRGWGEVATLNHDTVQLFDVPRSYMHGLIDALCDGKSIEEYLAAIEK